jgi:L-histidine N-alpha-methyltransferase
VSGTTAALAEEVRAGLTRPGLKELHPKHAYDARGSELFDRITTLPEYYPTRCERAILERHAAEIVAGAEELVELGSGTATKTRVLLGAMAGGGRLRRYVPFDVDASVIERCHAELPDLYPGLVVDGVVGDFEGPLDGIPPAAGPRVVALLGGTIGNFRPAERAGFLRKVRALLGHGDRFLLGADLVKDTTVLEAAYNDSAGVTAEFNRNVLCVLNRELGANFDPGAFEHVAFFDRERSWIDIRLRALGAQRVSIPGAGIEVELAAGEEIRTEVSTKFTRATVDQELAEAGMAVDAFYTDPDGLFALSLAVRR